MRRSLRDGAPYLAVLAVFVVTCAALLVVTAVERDRSTRGFAELTITQDACKLNEPRALNAVRCSKLTEGLYRVTFSASIADSTPVVTRASEGGRINARLAGKRSVDLLFPADEVYPISVSVLLP